MTRPGRSDLVSGPFDWAENGVPSGTVVRRSLSLRKGEATPGASFDRATDGLCSGTALRRPLSAVEGFAVCAEPVDVSKRRLLDPIGQTRVIRYLHALHVHPSMR